MIINFPLRQFVLLLLSAAVVSGCANVLGLNGPVRIMSSLPFKSSAPTSARAIDNGIQYALAEHGAGSGKFTILYEAFDNANGAPTSDWWQEFSNAFRGVANKSVVAYIGVPGSYAAHSTISILDEGGPLAMVSPVNSYTGFTKAYDIDEPAKYFPVGRPNFARVIPPADKFAAQSAQWIQAQNAKTVAILRDEEWDSRALGRAFESEAKNLGLTISASASYSPTLTGRNAVIAGVAATNADVIFLAVDESSDVGTVVKSLRAGGWKGTLLTTSNLATRSFVTGAGADGTMIILAGMSPEEVAQSGAQGKKWYDGYVAKFAVKPDYQSLQAYEATRVVLQAIDSCIAGNELTRLCVTEKIRATKDFKSLFGVTWSFDSNGDTTLDMFNVYKVKNGELLKSQ
jgi:branched-chain amino acid transport system substrate-binding protein